MELCYSQGACVFSFKKILCLDGRRSHYLVSARLEGKKSDKIQKIWLVSIKVESPRGGQSSERELLRGGSAVKCLLWEGFVATLHLFMALIE